MCGLYGSLGKNINVAAVRHLAHMNESRGKDAAGFFAADGDWYKCGQTAISDWLRDAKLRAKIEQFALTGAICGHTRGGTRGGNTTANAHPFSYAYGVDQCDNLRGHRVILSHNGVVDAPYSYAVDSMYMADLLSQADPGDYQKALREVEGWYVLTWLDERNQCIYFLNWQGQLSFTSLGKTIYYASSSIHLETALGCPVTRTTTDDGEVWRWDIRRGKMHQLPKFTGKKRSSRVVYCGHNSHHYEYDELELTGQIKKIKTGQWVANTRGMYYFRLKSQEHWERRFPGCETWTYRSPGVKEVIADIDEDSLMDWNGLPVDESRLFRKTKKKKAAEEDTVIEPSEQQGVVVTQTPGVSDTPNNKALQDLQAGMDIAKHDREARIGADARRLAGIYDLEALESMLQGLAGCDTEYKQAVEIAVKQRRAAVESTKTTDSTKATVEKALELQEQIDRQQRNSRYEEGEDRADPTEVRRIAAQQRIVKEYQIRKQAGYSDDQIDKDLFMEGYYDDLDDWSNLNTDKLRKWFEDGDMAPLPLA